MEGHSSTVNSVAIRPDNTKIVSGSSDNTIKVWDLESGRLLNTLNLSSYVNSVAITSDNSKIVSSGSADKIIKVWDLNTGKLLNTVEGHTDNIFSVAISPDSTKIVSGSYDKTIKVWEMQKAKYSASYKFDSGITYIAFFRNRNIMLIKDQSGEGLYLASLSQSAQNEQNEVVNIKPPIMEQ